MRTGAGLSTRADTREASCEAAEKAFSALERERPDVALVFASPHHAESAAGVLDGVHSIASPAALVGCVGEAVIGGSREIEAAPAVSVWLGAFGKPVDTFHMEFLRTESGGAFTGWRFDDSRADGDGPPRVHVVIADPFSFPVDMLLRYLNANAPRARVVGGLASGGTRRGETVLLLDRTVEHEGAVGLRLPAGVGIRTLVSQGCRPIGDPFVVTRADENFLLELGGRPPLERLRELLGTLSRPDQELVSNGLHVGRVIDEYKPDHGLGDYLVRGVLGANPETGALAVGDIVEVGETVTFHVRDSATADEELRSMLQREVSALPGRPVGALLFTCNGRGSRMFSTPDHDARIVSSFLGGAPVAGFFCAGELGPVGGRNFLHGFTASLVVFVDERSRA